MKVRVPPSAPGFEPVQGASRKSMPFLASAVAILRLADGETVLASTTTDPGFAVWMMPSEPRMAFSDISVSPTHKNMQSDFAPTSAGVAHAVPFPLAANSVALEAVCDHNDTSCPA